MRLATILSTLGDKTVRCLMEELHIASDLTTINAVRFLDLPGTGRGHFRPRSVLWGAFPPGFQI